MYSIINFQVLSLNFHSFYSNESEICHLEHFHADYSTLRFQENILTKGTAKLNKVEHNKYHVYTTYNVFVVD